LGGVIYIEKKERKYEKNKSNEKKKKKNKRTKYWAEFAILCPLTVEKDRRLWL